MTTETALPRELVLASAGTGKTFRISSRIIGLLAHGVEPDQVFASTFTRKAAGEILARVLQRLARASLRESDASTLAGHAGFGPASPMPTAAEWQNVLHHLTDRLHRVDIGTLDSFFVRVAGSFALELGLPQTWHIADAPSSARLESEALEDILESADREEVLELIRALAGGDATRSVHERILDHARELRSLLHQIDPRAERPWHPFTRDEAPPTPEERNRVADRIQRLQPPSNKDGSPSKIWQNSLETSAVAVREGDWDGIVEKGIGSKILEGETEYSRKAIQAPVAEAFEEALELARRAIRADLAARSRALGALAERFDGALDARQRRDGSFGFDDVTRMVGGVDPLAARTDLWYRLDQRARHLLLDEFQDTSLLQWEALRPLAEEILSGHAGERATVIVADPKQSIYGWRGAEPELVRRVGRRFVLDQDRLRRSYRSSSRVLDFVNRIFEDMDRRSIWGDDPEDRAFVRDWLEDFEPHEAAKDLPGRVRVEVGPREPSMRSDDRPLMMRRAAEQIAEIRRRAPDFTVGALLRKNRNVPLLIAELRARGIEASEEGGTLLTDSPAVAAVLALLRLADHPGHTIARYHVAHSPLGTRLGLDAHDDAASGRALSGRVRERLLHDGYGPTLDTWARMLAADATLGARDHRRIAQLVELGFAWDGKGPTLRPGDFVRFVETEKVEDPVASAVRVMTVHQAKGLEFDVVLLPELDLRMIGGGGRTPAALPERDPETGRILRIFPYVKAGARQLVPEVGAAVSDDRRAALRDALGLLYVGMTRARFALHLLMAADPDGGPGSSPTFARLVREALGTHEEPVADGDVLFEDGADDWPERVPEEERRPAGHLSPPEPVELDVRLASGGSRQRILPHRNPSELEGGRTVELSELLSLDEDGSRESARRKGVVIHEWCRRIGWVDEGLPDPDLLLTIGRRTAPEMSDEELRSLRDDFFRWLERPVIRRVLSRQEARGSAPANGAEGSGAEELRSEETGLREMPAEEVRLEREWPFAVRKEDEIVEGVVDRLVLFQDADGRVRGARVLDFKTDRVDPDGISGLVERYRPQLEAYRDAVCRAHSVESERVEALLVFLSAGRVEPVPRS